MQSTSKSKKFYLDAYYYLRLTRRFEETLIRLYHSGKLRGHPHSGIGQEAIGVGSVLALQQDDMICPAVRTISSILTKGVEPKVLLSEAFRKANSPSAGKWLYHHICLPDKGIILGSAVVAGSMPVAVGAAMASKMKETEQVVLCYFGDGASSRGDFHEAVNFASVFKLPIVFICENNQYALSTPLSRQMNNEDIADRAIGYGIPGHIVNGGDVFEVHKYVSDAVNIARSGQGPSLIECKTYRLRAHSEIDPEDMGRPPEELAFWRSQVSSIDLCKRYILEEYGAEMASELEKIDKKIEDELSDAVEFAQNSPDPNPETAVKGVYAEANEVQL